MEVLLLQDVDQLGNAGDVKRVAGGYARNYLFPRNLAVLATPGAIKKTEQVRRAEIHRQAKEKVSPRGWRHTRDQTMHERVGWQGQVVIQITGGDSARQAGRVSADHGRESKAKGHNPVERDHLRQIPASERGQPVEQHPPEKEEHGVIQHHTKHL